MRVGYEARAKAVGLRARASLARVAMTGTSMLPLLHAPMVLELGPPEAVRVGDVIAFWDGLKIVAHRVVLAGDGTFRTAGDAHPECVEIVSADAVLGRVERVWSHDGSQAYRVDGFAHRLSGSLLAHTRPLRATAARAARILPRRRTRVFSALCDLLAADLSDDREAFVSALRAAPADAIVRGTKQHRCGALLAHALYRYGLHDDPACAPLVEALRRDAWGTAASNADLQRDVDTCVTALSIAGIPFALLKGAARAYRGDPKDAVHPSSDIDVLVPKERLDAAIAALSRYGYTTPFDRSAAEAYRRRHHHAAPMLPASGSIAVELHTAIARPKTLERALDWRALEPYFQPCHGFAGPVRCLDERATFAHLAIHSLDELHLRDVYLMARILRTAGWSSSADLGTIGAGDPAEPIRLNALFALAARIARVAWPTAPAERRYLSWLERREDLPENLRRHAYFAEAAHAARRARDFVRVWGTGIAGNPAKAEAVTQRQRLTRLLARAASGIAAYLYAAAMRERG